MTDQEFLESRGWVKIAPGYDPRWTWQQPKTRALFTLKDAVDVQRGLDKEKRCQK